MRKQHNTGFKHKVRLLHSSRESLCLQLTPPSPLLQSNVRNYYQQFLDNLPGAQPAGGTPGMMQGYPGGPFPPRFDASAGLRPLGPGACSLPPRCFSGGAQQGTAQHAGADPTLTLRLSLRHGWSAGWVQAAIRQRSTALAAATWHAAGRLPASLRRPTAGAGDAASGDASAGVSATDGRSSPWDAAWDVSSDQTQY